MIERIAVARLAVNAGERDGKELLQNRLRPRVHFAERVGEGSDGLSRFKPDAGDAGLEIVGDARKVVVLRFPVPALNAVRVVVNVVVDGSGVGEVGSVVMRDRHRLAEDGMVVIVVTLSSWDNVLLSDPEILTRGFVYVKEAEDMLEELKRVTKETVLACEENGVKDWSAIKSRIKSNVSGYLYKTTKRSPMILPLISEI